MRRNLFGLAAVVVAATTGLSAEKPPAVGQQAKDFELKSIGGETVKLTELTAKGPVVLVVLRGYPGYQCPLCTRQVGELVGQADAIKKAGAQVVLVYPGPADGLKAHAEEFVRGKDYPAHYHLVLDPDYTFTNAYGLRWDARNETAYPSTFVLDKDRKVTFAKVSRSHGDRAKTSDVVKALPAN